MYRKKNLNAVNKKTDKLHQRFSQKKKANNTSGKCLQYLKPTKGLILIRKEKQETIICNPVKNQFNRKMGTEKNKEFTRNYYILTKNALS